METLYKEKVRCYVIKLTVQKRPNIGKIWDPKKKKRGQNVMFRQFERSMISVTLQGMGDVNKEQT